MTDIDRIESDREFREGISPLVIELCCVCSHMIDYCECACEAPTGASHD